MRTHRLVALGEMLTGLPPAQKRRRANRAAQTGVFDLDIRISNRPFIDVCKSIAAETGLKSRNFEKRINAV
jgi:hypothetical protein